ncbi:MAG: patatin family protein [Spirochaetes bacterium]|nr:patatin family protein [Spirochaetota bacterium]
MKVLSHIIKYVSKQSQKKSYPKKKVLILEGGGMRGVFLTGVLQAFTDRDYFPFKLIIGSSAGALTGVAYSASQIYLARDAFFGVLLSNNFIKISNILRPTKHILNLDWMVSTVIEGKETLNFQYLKHSIPVLITATEYSDNNPPATVYLNSKKDDIVTALKASAAIPVLYRGFVEYQNRKLCDGGLLDPIPFKKALHMGFKEEDILVVVTRKKGYRKKEESFWIRYIIENYFKDSKYRYLIQALENRYIMYNAILDELEHTYKNISVIYPPDDFNVDRLTRDPKKILEGFEQGVQSGKNFLLS